MKISQKITLIFSLLGCLAGILSNYINSLTYSLIISLIIYSIPSFFLFSSIKLRKRKSLISDSIITFILVWFFVWTLLYNFG